MASHPDHYVLHRPIYPPFPEQYVAIYFAGGCFWGVEEIFWKLPEVFTTFVGYANGTTPEPSYEQVCTGKTGHAETAAVVYNPEEISVRQLLITFWETHDPTQGMRQGGDIGTQYRSGIYITTPEQLAVAEQTRKEYEPALLKAGFDPITTEITPLHSFYYAEDYHQQYLAKNPNGYRCHAATGVAFPVSTVA